MSKLNIAGSLCKKLVSYVGTFWLYIFANRTLVDALLNAITVAYDNNFSRTMSIAKLSSRLAASTSLDICSTCCDLNYSHIDSGDSASITIGNNDIYLGGSETYDNNLLYIGGLEVPNGYVAYKLPIPDVVGGVTSIRNSYSKPTVTLFNGVDFTTNGDTIFFKKEVDPLHNPSFTVNHGTVTLWFNNAQLDSDMVEQVYGPTINSNYNNSAECKELVNVVADTALGLSSPEQVNKLVSTLLPGCKVYTWKDIDKSKIPLLHLSTAYGEKVIANDYTEVVHVNGRLCFSLSATNTIDTQYWSLLQAKADVVGYDLDAYLGSRLMVNPLEFFAEVGIFNNSYIFLIDGVLLDDYVVLHSRLEDIRSVLPVHVSLFIVNNVSAFDQVDVDLCTESHEVTTGAVVSNTIVCSDSNPIINWKRK